MFKFLKEKLKSAVSRFTRKVDEEAEPITPVEEPIVEPQVKAVKKPKPKETVPKIKEELEEEISEPEIKEEEAPEPIEEEPSPEPADEAVIEEEPEPVKVVEPEPTIVEDIPKEEPKRGFFEKIFKKEHKPEPTQEVKPETKPEEKRTFFKAISETVTKKAISESKFEELFFELELALLESNVAVEVIEKIKSDLKVKLVDQKVLRGQIDQIISDTLVSSINDLFVADDIDFIKLVKTKKPYVILFLGVNGSGKTTNLAKVANYLKTNGLSVVVAACDTFRAAAIQQIEEHTNNLGLKLIKHEYGADAAAVAFDAVKHAEASGKDVVLIDTAGRSHSNVNLMDELKKVVRVAKPDLKIFVGDSLTGNDAVLQAHSFDEAVGIDGIILSKLDVDEKGGAAISVSFVTRKPIFFVGTGQTYADLKPFNKQIVIDNLGIV